MVFFQERIFVCNNVKKTLFPVYIVWLHMAMLLCFSNSSEICDNCDNCV